MLTIVDEFNRLWRNIQGFWAEHSSNPIFWLGIFLFGIFMFKLVWDALSKEK